MFSSGFAEFEPPWALNHQINWDDDADLSYDPLPRNPWLPLKLELC